MSGPFRKGKLDASAGGEGGGGQFIKIAADNAVVVAPLVSLDDMISCDQHEFWDINPAIIVPCIGKGCPACETSVDARFKAFLPVLTKDEGVKIFSFGIRVYRQLAELETEIGSLKGKVIKIKRTGEGLKTQYMIIPTGKTMKVEDQEVPDIESMLGPTTKAEIRAKLEAAGLLNVKSDVDEEENPKVKSKASKPAETSTDDDEQWEEV